MKKLLLTFSFLFASYYVALAQQYTIATLAGNGIVGYIGNGGSATAAELYGPHGLFIDDSGSTYIADQGNSVIRKVSKNGIISTFAGNGKFGYLGDGGAATASELGQPAAATNDNMGNVYITDVYLNMVRKVNTNGIISTIVGTGGYGYSGDNGPATAAELYAPTGSAVDIRGNLYIADGGNNRIRMINTNGIISTIAGTGVAGFSGDGSVATGAKINNPKMVCVDVAGNIYFTDLGNNCVRKINTNNVISTIAGDEIAGFSGDGGQAIVAQLNEPFGLALDAAGNIYISDVSNDRIRKVDFNGIISTIAGNGFGAPDSGSFSGDGGMATNAGLYAPEGVAVDATGNVYIGDVANDRIRKLTLVTGINELSNTSSVNLYPNPNKGIFNLQLKTNNYSKAIVSIYNVLGARVASSLLEPGIVSQPGGQGWAIDISNQPAGIYLYRITDETGELIATGKFVTE